MHKSTVLKHEVAGQEHPAFGAPLTVHLSEQLAANSELKLRVYYHTTAASTALGWMEAQQTSTKKFPFLFTQCEAIHARSLLPCQGNNSSYLHWTSLYSC